MVFEGVYRKSGATSSVRKMRNIFEHCSTISEDASELFDDISTVTSVMKQYLRLLPTPLIPYDYSGHFLQLQGGSKFDHC